MSGLDPARARRVEAGASDFPTRLRDLAPDVGWLDVRGAAPPRGPAVALVGQRRATSYGREVTAWLADALATAGVTVVSGGAVGVDAAAHRAAVDAGGHTVVVLGCGIDVRYPAVHAQRGGLFGDVLEAGGTLVSQWERGTEPHARTVLARNRLVAALADAVVVVEGRQRSGALNTAGHAADLGVPVLAVPGDVRAPGSAAPHRLLAEGCAPCRDPEDVLAAIGARFDLLDRPTADPTPTVLPGPVRAVLDAAYPQPVAVDHLAAEAGQPAGTLLALLTRARIAGEVTTEAGGVRLRRQPARPARPR